MSSNSSGDAGEGGTSEPSSARSPERRGPGPRSDAAESSTSRARIHAWLELSRFPLVFTVAGNALAAAAVSGLFDRGLHGPWWDLPLRLLAPCLAYLAGMILNDAADADRDRTLYPRRPIPSGRIARATAFKAGFGLLATSLLAALPLGARPLLASTGLIAAILGYNLIFKENRFLGPIFMGLCRGLVVALAGSWGAGLLALAGVQTLYTAALTRLSLDEDGPEPAPGSAVSGGPMIVHAAAMLALWGGVAAWVLTTDLDPPVLRRAASGIFALVGLSFAAEAWRKRSWPRAQGVGQAVRHGLYAFLALDAGWALAAGRPELGLAIALLLGPVVGARVWIRKWARS